MSAVLNKVRDVDPNNSEAVKEALSTFFQNLSKHTDTDCIRWLRALETIINRFPKYCMSYRNVIESHILFFLDCNASHNVIQAGICAHALQQVRPSQEKTATPKTSWRDQLSLLCNAAHTLIAALFPNAVDIHQYNKKQQEQPLSNSALSAVLCDITSTTHIDSKHSKHDLLATRLRNVFVFIQAMLVEVYPVAKPVRPQIVLDVITRALSVSSGTKNGDHSLDDVVDVKIQALRCLDALVACLGSNLIPFSPLVFRIVMQTLKWTSDNPSEESRLVRVTAYNSLCHWLTTLHAHQLSARWEDELKGYLISDVTPQRHLIQLNVNAQQPTKNMSKKAKRKLANTMLLQSNISSHMPGDKGKTAVSEEGNEAVTLAALECTETFLTVCGLFLKPQTHKIFQERLVRECFNVQSSSVERSLGLFRALEAARKSAPPGVPPPTQYCLQLYSAALSSAHPQISTFCSRALLDIRLHLHCSPPSINFAVEVQPDTQNEREEKKKISEKNRAALAALLGESRMSNLEDDVISIPDEPVTKKQRIEEEIEEQEEQISLSSESDHGEDSGDAEILEIVDEIDASGKNITNQNVQNETDQNFQNENDQDGLNSVANETELEIQITEEDENNTNIHEINTQMPRDTSMNETDDEETTGSMEVAYDYPNSGKETVPVLEAIGGDNLPSTNETDDVQITCGQVVQSQERLDTEIDVEINVVTQEADNSEPTVNGISERLIQNGFSDQKENENEVGEVEKRGKLTIEEMLADFVDEVVDNKTQITQAQ